jgi:NADH dehydrogenase
MSSRRIGVTGATGFIGSHLVRRLAERGDAVIAFQRDPGAGAASRPRGVATRAFRMPDGIEPADFAGLDAVVHTALVEYGPAAPDADAINRAGTRRVVDAARAAGARLVFLSTLSAHDRATSHYGRNKLELETLFDPGRDAVLRLGLVLGRGGLFGSMTGLLKNASVVPLPGGGRQPIQVLWMGDLEDAVLAVIDRGLAGSFDVAHPEVRTMRELYEAICASLGVKRTFVSVPLALVELGAGMLETLRIPFPIRRENVLGLKQLRAFDTAPSLRALGIGRPLGLEEALARLSEAG